jgi:hypothetical protein
VAGDRQPIVDGAQHSGSFLAEIVNTLESGRDPGVFWAKWIEVVVADAGA